MRVALVYDRVNKWGGAERVLLALHEIFPDAPLYTSVYNPETASWAKIFPRIYTSFLQQIPLARKNHQYLATLMPLAFESFNFDRYNLVVSVTSEAAKGIITKPQTKHICYCLTPTRYLWSGYDEYFKGSTLKTISWPLVSYLRKWDKVAAKRPDSVISISREVSRRIKTFYNRNSQVIYPAIDDVFLRGNRNEKAKKEDYFLVVSRLIKYKNIDLIVKVFNKLGYPLIVAGTGSEEKRLERLAKSNIIFVGAARDSELIDYYTKAKAVIMMQIEDFGLVSLESQACGTPVVALSDGGAKETITDGVTGILFAERSENGLIVALERFNSLRFNPLDLTNNARMFSKEKFKKEFLSVIKFC